jgi:protease-4
MLKKFFISMLGSIAGVWIAIVIVIIAVLSVIGGVLASRMDSTTVEKHTALYIDLNGAMPEYSQSTDVMSMLQGSDTDGDTFIDVVSSIKLAANDSRIDGIYINAAGTGAGMAAREEIVAALRNFKKSGKWIIAYADSYSQADYQVSAMADSLSLNPMGHVDIHGVASQVMYYKRLLDKLDIKVNVVRVGQYKSAVEPFLTDEMSPASREQLQVLVDSLWTCYAESVKKDRKIGRALLKGCVDSIVSTFPAEDLVGRIVTATKYRRQVEDVIRDFCGIDSGDDLRLVTPSEYMASRGPVNADRPHIALLFAAGDIVDSGRGGIVGDEMVPEILKLADDENVKALVLRINSGGGSAFASEQIWEALEYFKAQGKPFYVSMGDYAASGGYYIACGADKIFADRGTLTGSIGVFGMVPDFSTLASDKLGITFSTVSSNQNATFMSTMAPMTPTQHAALQRSVDDVYDRFTSRVAKGRNLSQDSVKVIAQGRVWTGGDALARGLVDKIGSLDDAIAAIAKKANLDADAVVMYPKVDSRILAELIRTARQGVSVEGAYIDAETLRVISFVRYLRECNPVQARMNPISFN